MGTAIFLSLCLARAAWTASVWTSGRKERFQASVPAEKNCLCIQCICVQVGLYSSEADSAYEMMKAQECMGSQRDCTSSPHARKRGNSEECCTNKQILRAVQFSQNTVTVFEEWEPCFLRVNLHFTMFWNELLLQQQLLFSVNVWCSNSTWFWNEWGF